MTPRMPYWLLTMKTAIDGESFILMSSCQSVGNVIAIP